MTKNIFVTGTSSGIGEQIVIALLGAGQSVVGLSRRESPIIMGHPHYKHIHLDLSDLNELERAISSGKLSEALDCDVAYLNAGTFGPTPNHGHNLELTDFTHVMNVNCISNKLLLDALAREDRPIKIGISSSISSVRFRAGMSVYSASKASLNALAHIYAKEYPRMFIVNIGLCNVDTPLWQTILTPNLNPDLEELSALRERAKQPGYLSSPASRADQLIKITTHPELFGVQSGEFIEIRSLSHLLS
ncbi:SDR family oxidoreductase [Acetobacter sp. P5B1]|uniref:SDR family oxidoreductase n=1 Tax=Acetobacter sp. P5B1 TaxID=2762620 RepID=UPI001C05149C|nr:SDR family oxidoreductase [Acetobacter sp. P5B1]